MTLQILMRDGTTHLVKPDTHVLIGWEDGVIWFQPIANGPEWHGKQEIELAKIRSIGPQGKD